MATALGIPMYMPSRMATAMPNPEIKMPTATAGRSAKTDA
jgi:hypothetical protein